MSTVEVIQQPAATVELVMAGGAVVEVECAAPAVVEIASVGTQGIKGLAGVPDHIQVVANVASGQSAFLLDYVPPNAARTRFWVNGQRFGPPDITVVADLLTWHQPFTLEPTDTVEITYPSQG